MLIHHITSVLTRKVSDTEDMSLDFYRLTCEVNVYVDAFLCLLSTNTLCLKLPVSGRFVREVTGGRGGGISCGGSKSVTHSLCVRFAIIITAAASQSLAQ